MQFIKAGEKDGCVILSDADGNKACFDFLEMAIVDNIEYAALLQIDNDSVILMQFEEKEDGNEIYTVIEDDSVFDKVCAAFAQFFEED